MPIASLDEIRGKVGQTVGVSGWIEVGQDRIDQFAEATDDHQFIHVDQELARQTPFGGTIAHGFLSLSLLSRMAADVMLIPDTTKMAVNYGLDRVRFPAPVPSGGRIRARFSVEAVREVAAGVQVTLAATVEREGAEKPVCVATVVFRFVR